MHGCTVGGARLELVQGDITEEDLDAIVNAANSSLEGGGGVDGAIHRAGGPSILEECRQIGHCDTGDAVITTAGDLPAKYVIHTVGPVWHGGDRQEPDLLESCYRRSLAVAVEHDVADLAFPSISTGAYRYPVDSAARVAINTVAAFLEEESRPELVRFVLFDEPTLHAYGQALEDFVG